MRTLGLLVIAALMLGGCAGSASEDDGRRVLTGIVTTVEATSLTNVESFTLRSEGEDFVIEIDPEITYAFPPEHLRAHAISSEPVRVEVEDRSGTLFALTLEDA
ncbi:MAG: hypothetical protein GEU71_05140 [Actinobacteria bacterium]|jgi:hypothetical protein|nr:hypothetical protein [Actinomycetota bacterium]